MPLLRKRAYHEQHRDELRARAMVVPVVAHKVMVMPVVRVRRGDHGGQQGSGADDGDQDGFHGGSSSSRTSRIDARGVVNGLGRLNAA